MARKNIRLKDKDKNVLLPLTTVGQVEGLNTALTNITDKIPTEATSENKLADKAFVNSTVQTATANFRGSWLNWGSVPTDASLYPVDYAGSHIPTVNDYMVVQDASGYTPTNLPHARVTTITTGSSDASIRIKFSSDGTEIDYQYNTTPSSWADVGNKGLIYIRYASLKWHIKAGTAGVTLNNVYYAEGEIVAEWGYDITVDHYMYFQSVAFTGTWRFKYTGVWSTLGKNGWKPEYRINEEPLTDAQLAALNSTITKTKVDTYDAHVVNTNNPHNVTKAQVGLGNVDNTSDLNKPISTATQNALNEKQDTIVSGTHVKTLNNTSIVGSGNLVVDKTFVGLENVDNTADLDKPVSTATQTELNKKINYTDIVDNVASTATNKPLSANQGKELNDRITNLEGRGRFLSTWNCITGKPTTNPSSLPYTYKSGDWYLVGKVGTTNYRPTGSSYTGDASTTVEVDLVSVNDMYTYDGTAWILHKTEEPVTSFSEIAGDPYDNANLASALNEKQDNLTNDNAGTNISITPATGDEVAKINFVNTPGYQTGTDVQAKINVHDASTDAHSDIRTAINTKQDKLPTVVNDRYLHTDSSGNLEWAEAGKVDDVKVNGTTVVTDKIAEVDITEKTMILEEDLYTFTPIGKITAASNTNPVKVASAGANLKAVFNKILGEQQDANPTINQSGTTFTKSAQTGNTSVSGAEVGTSISQLTGTVTYSVKNTGTCSYGLKAGTTDTYSKTTATTFNYPTKTRTVTVNDTSYSYQVRIKYPELNGCTLSITTGTLVVDDTTNRYLYCNTNNAGNIVVNIVIPATNSTTSSITRFNQLEADVEFEPATYNGTVIDNFWTYLKKPYTATGMTRAAVTGVKSTSYVVTAGSYFPYYTQTTTATIPTTATKSTDANCYTNGVSLTMSADGYVWMLIPSAISKTKIQYYAAGSWNDMATTNEGTTTFTLASGASATYKVFRTAQEQASGAALKVRLQ